MTVLVTVLAASAGLCFDADPNKPKTLQAHTDSDLCARQPYGR
jgi:hypothetical protein